MLRFPQRAGDEPAGGDGAGGAKQVRRGGKLTDAATREFIAAHLVALKAWVLRMR